MSQGWDGATGMSLQMVYVEPMDSLVVGDRLGSRQERSIRVVRYRLEHLLLSVARRVTALRGQIMRCVMLRVSSRQHRELVAQQAWGIYSSEEWFLLVDLGQT